MWLQRQHFLLSYFKTLSVGPAGVELTTSRMAVRCSTDWATGARHMVPAKCSRFKRLKVFESVLPSEKANIKLIRGNLKCSKVTQYFSSVRYSWKNIGDHTSVFQALVNGGDRRKTRAGDERAQRRAGWETALLAHRLFDRPLWESLNSLGPHVLKKNSF